MPRLSEETNTCSHNITIFDIPKRLIRECHFLEYSTLYKIKSVQFVVTTLKRHLGRRRNGHGCVHLQNKKWALTLKIQAVQGTALCQLVKNILSVIPNRIYENRLR